MWTIINRHLAKMEESRGGVSRTPYVDVVQDTLRYAKEDRAWKEHKNSKRQALMKNLAYGTSLTFNDKDLQTKKDRFQRYYDKHKGSMDESSLELGQMYLENYNMQAEKNTEFDQLQLDGERLKKDMMYDMQNIGVDEEGNRRTLDDNDYKIIKDMQKQWMDHTKKMKIDFADRLELKSFEHINAELTNAKNINDFLLLEAREDNLIDDKEMQAYQDAWKDFNYAPVQKYYNNEGAGKKAAITFNANELLTGAKRYKDLDNLFKNPNGVIPFKDPQLDGQVINITADELRARPEGSVGRRFLTSLIREYDSLPQQLRNLNKTNIDLSNVDFLRTTDLSLHEIPPNVQEQILAGDKTILDVKKVQETVAGPKGRAEKVKEAAGISDDDMGALGKLGLGAGAVGLAYQRKNIAKIGAKVADVTVKAGKYVEELTHLKPGQIREFLSSKDVGANLKNIESLEIDIAELKDKIKNTKGLDKLTQKDKLKIRLDEKNLAKATAKIEDIKTKMSKRWASKFKTKPRIISSLFKKGTTDKWNLWKAKSGLPKLGQRYAIGSILTDKVLGFEIEGASRIAVDITTGYAAEKFIVKKFFPQLKRIIQSPKGQKYLLKFMAENTAKRIGTAAVLGGGWLSLATSLIGAGLAINDIKNIVKNWNPEEEEE